MDSCLQEFLESHIGLIDQNQFDELYAEAKESLGREYIADLTNLLYEADIDPVDYFKKELPPYFLSRDEDIQTFEFSSNQTHITDIGPRAFEGCINLKTFWIPSHIKEICYSAFDGCINLSDVQFIEPSNLHIIDDFAFASCQSLKELVLPEGVTTIRSYAFAESGIKKLYLPESVVNIDWSTFDQWRGGILYIKKGAFIEKQLSKYPAEHFTIATYE